METQSGTLSLLQRTTVVEISSETTSFIAKISSEIPSFDAEISPETSSLVAEESQETSLPWGSHVRNSPVFPLFSEIKNKPLQVVSVAPWAQKQESRKYGISRHKV